MMRQFRMLQDLKRLHEDKALRVLEKARSSLRETEERRDALAVEVEESATTMPARERSIFSEFLNTVVDMGRIDGANSDVLDLREQHQKLVDRLDRAKDAVTRAEKRLQDSRLELRKRQQDTEKIDTVAEEIRVQIEDEVIQREEVEIEDLFARPRGMAGIAAL